MTDSDTVDVLRIECERLAASNRAQEIRIRQLLKMLPAHGRSVSAEEGVVNKTATIRFVYRNYKNVVQIRTVVPDYIWYGKTAFHKVEGWFLHAIDSEKETGRDFFMEDILAVIKKDQEFSGVPVDTDRNTE